MTLYEQWIWATVEFYPREIRAIELYRSHLKEFECGGLILDHHLSCKAKDAITAIGMSFPEAKVFFATYFDEWEKEIAWHMHQDGILPDDWEEVF